MDIYQKARATGLDERQIALAQAPFDTNVGRTIDIHEAHDRVVIHAAAYDAGGSVVVPGIGGITVTPDGVTLWRRCPPAVRPEVRRAWNRAKPEE
jgi:hypothetical protein